MKLKHGSHLIYKNLVYRWSMHLQRQHHHSIRSACGAACISHVSLEKGLLCKSVWAMKISWWVSASGWILKNSQLNHNCFVVIFKKKKNMKTKTKPKTNPKKPHHTSSNVTRSGALPVLEGYWIFPFPGNTIKVSTISKLKKVSFYTSQLEAYLSLADEWFADSIWTEHLQPRPTKVERRFWWFLSHQLLGVTFNTGVVHVGTQYAILYHKKGKYLI